MKEKPTPKERQLFEFLRDFFIKHEAFDAYESHSKTEDFLKEEKERGYFKEEEEEEFFSDKCPQCANWEVGGKICQKCVDRNNK